MTYAEKLRDPRWQKARLAIFTRDNWGCRLCGDETTTLAVHHIKYTSPEPWTEPEANMVTVCDDCHEIVRHCTTTRQEAKFRGLMDRTQVGKVAAQAPALVLADAREAEPTRAERKARHLAPPSEKEDLF